MPIMTMDVMSTSAVQFTTEPIDGNANFAHGAVGSWNRFARMEVLQSRAAELEFHKTDYPEE